MKSLGIKTRIFIAVAVLIVALGIVMVSVFGFNKPASLKNGWELSVRAVDNVDTEKESSIIKQETDSYLNGLGVKTSGVRSYDQGCWYVVSFTDNYADTIDTTALKNAISDKFGEYTVLSGIEIKVAYNETVNNVYGQNPLNVALAVIITAIVVFGYVALTEKSIASALAVICSSAISALVFFGAIALFRIPAEPFIAVGIAAAVLAGSVLSYALVNRFKEEIRLQNTAKPDFDVVASIGLKKSVLRICLTTAGIALFGLILLIFGLGGNIAFAGLQLVFVALCSALTTLAFTPLIWKAFKSIKTKKTLTAETVDEK